jgi:uncharacterized protein YgiM (DUF1202 family)
MKCFVETNFFVSLFVVAAFLSSSGCGHSTPPPKSSASTKNPKYDESYNPPLKLYVKEKSVNIRSGPGKEYEVIATAKKRQLITVNGKKQDWYYISQVDESKDGYIYQELLSSEKPKFESANTPAAQALTPDDTGLMAFPPRSPLGSSTDDTSVKQKPETAAPQPPPVEPEEGFDLFGPKEAPAK